MLHRRICSNTLHWRRQLFRLEMNNIRVGLLVFTESCDVASLLTWMDWLPVLPIRPKLWAADISKDETSRSIPLAAEPQARHEADNHRRLASLPSNTTTQQLKHPDFPPPSPHQNLKQAPPSSPTSAKSISVYDSVERTSRRETSQVGRYRRFM
jgi:hypothetical protein